MVDPRLLVCPRGGGDPRGWVSGWWPSEVGLSRLDPKGRYQGRALRRWAPENGLQGVVPRVWAPLRGVGPWVRGMSVGNVLVGPKWVGSRAVPGGLDGPKGVGIRG